MHSKFSKIFLFILTLVFIFHCSGYNTQQILNGDFIEEIFDPITVSPSKSTISTEEQLQINCSGGKEPYSYAITIGLGSINANDGTYTASTLPSETVIVCTDSRNQTGVAQVTVYGKTVQPNTITGLRLWLKADTLSLTDGDPISTWQDSSGQGVNAVASGTGRPEYVASDTNFANKPSVKFNGSTNFMVTNSEFFNFVEHTFFIVIYQTSTTSYRFILEDHGATNENFAVRVGNSGGLQHLATDATGDTIAQYGVLKMKDIERILMGNLEDRRTILSIDGNSDGAAGISSYEDTTEFSGTKAGYDTGMTIGRDNLSTGTKYLTGQIAEIIFYDSKLSDSAIVTIGCYLSEKYSINYKGCSPK